MHCFTVEHVPCVGAMNFLCDYHFFSIGKRVGVIFVPFHVIRRGSVLRWLGVIAVQLIS